MPIKIFYPYLNGYRSTNRELQKLIASATGDNLTYLVDRLQILLKKKQAAEFTKEEKDQKEDKEETHIEPPSPPLPIIEKHKSVKIVRINQETLKDLFIKAEDVQDFINKCVNYVVENFPKDQDVMKLIKSKLHLQLKVVMEYSHDKPYEPALKYIKKAFYVDKINQRCNLVQSVADFRTVLENQAKAILRMIDSFEHQGSNWMIVKQLKFTLRIIRFFDRFNRVIGFIPTPQWQQIEKQSSTFRIKMIIVFLSAFIDISIEIQADMIIEILDQSSNNFVNPRLSILKLSFASLH
jgi:hypothetical protein